MFGYQSVQTHLIIQEYLVDSPILDAMHMKYTFVEGFTNDILVYYSPT